MPTSSHDLFLVAVCMLLECWLITSEAERERDLLLLENLSVSLNLGCELGLHCNDFVNDFDDLKTCDYHGRGAVLIKAKFM